MATNPRPQGRAYLVPGQGPLGDQSAREAEAKIRDAVALRSPSLDTLEPRALDLAADTLAVLHGELQGRASALAGHRSPKHRREQIRGEDALAVEDLAYLALHAPRAVARALDVLARATGCRVVPSDPVAPRFAEAQARAAETFGTLQAAGIRAASDGRLDGGEVADLRKVISEHERTIAQLRESIEQHRHELDTRDGWR